MPVLPEKLLQSLQGVPGFDAGELEAAHAEKAVISLRLHPVKKGSGYEDAAQVPWCAEGRYLNERPVFTLDPAIHGGAYYVQEASSMFLDYMLRNLVADNNHLRVLDLCAAPGGKSTLIASWLGPESLLVSNEVIRTRAGILEENMTKWGYMNTWVTANDPHDFGRLPGYFDLMVVDAPCSGSGLFRKDAAALNEWSENNVALCNGRQRRILADAWPSLKEDGILIYATCSYSPEEDEEILDWLGDTYTVESLPVDVPDSWGIVPVKSVKHGFAGYRFFPGKVKGEGFFIAALRKREAAQGFYYPRGRSSHNKKAALQVAALLEPAPFVLLEDARKELIAIYPQHEPDYNLLREVAYLRKAGIAVGENSHKEWLPSHDLALSLDKSKGLPAIHVSKEQALLYLKKEPFEAPDMPKGWYLVCYNNISLGWVKVLSNRMNNYLPKGWRIRMELPD